MANRELLRKVYSTPEGRLALMDILNRSKFFSTEVSTPQEIVLENSAKILLEELGIWQGHNALRIVNALMNMPYLEGDQNGE
ncbi:MAG: hypothetical protein DRP09_12630 [Candidatus Thorarchaeota archaeon]|nr:MAG: hypothetical protein DRP09_12630 [Candidatus Thorarchaeota archaeon]